MIKTIRHLCLSLLAGSFSGVTCAEYTLYEGEYGQAVIGLQVQNATFGEVNNLSGSPDKANLTDSFLEFSAKPHLVAELNLPSNNKLYGGFSYVYSSSVGHDPSGYTQDNVDMYIRETDYTKLNGYRNYRNKSMTEELYLGWKSGNLMDGSGNMTVDVSGGKQNYKLGSGFLLYYGAENGGDRGASWINPRTAGSPYKPMPFLIYQQVSRIGTKNKNRQLNG